MQSVFIDIGAQRIQAWLSRWPDLKGRRGASAVLNGNTEPQRVVQYLADRGIQSVPTPGLAPIDGVIQLKLHNVAEQQPAVAALQAYLVQELPGLEFLITWASGTDYGEVANELRGKRDRRDGVTVLPVAAELPMVARCELTGSDLAIGTVALPGGQTRRAGRDARARHNAAGQRTDERSSGSSPGALTAETSLAQHLELKLIEDFGELATLTEPGRKNNHLATVFIDGNNVGNAFAALGGTGTAFSKQLKSAVDEALLEATTHVQRLSGAQADSKLAVVPHLVGGDDLLATVPAPLGMAFTLEFLKQFSERTKRAAVEHHLDIEVSASAGILIAHHSHPFADQIVIAERLLRKAKSGVGGKAASVCAAELTRESIRAVDEARVWRCSELDSYSDCLDTLAGAEQSTRHELLHASSTPHQHHARGRIARLLDRHDEIANALGGIDDPKLIRDLLLLSRWWK